MYQKKEELISDITLLLQGYNTQNGHRIIGLVRKGLNDLLLQEHHLTFEELIEIVKDFDQVCGSIQSRLDDVLKQRSQLLGNKEIKHDRQMLNSLEELKNKEQEELGYLQRCNTLNMLLQNAKLKETIVSLCQTLSEIQFSQEQITKQTCTRIVFSFLWIINQLSLQKNQKGMKGAKQHIDELIAQTTSALQSANVNAALQSYQNLIGAYYGLTKQEQAKYYADIFILWFEIQFFDNGKLNQYNS